MPAQYDANSHIPLIRELEIKLQEKEEECKKLKRKLTTFVEHSPLPTMITVGRKICYVNDRMCEATGYNKKELIGSGTQILYPNKQTYDFVGGLIQCYKEFTHKVDIKRKNGEIKPYFLKFTKSEDENYVTIYLEGGE